MGWGAQLRTTFGLLFFLYSSIVIRSANAWHGCTVEDYRLITGLWLYSMNCESTVSS